MFKSSLNRSVGCFLHISSLPSFQGIGCFDSHAKKFINFLASCGMSYWQICPMTPTIIGDSPYQGTSAFAGNPYFINLQNLVDRGFLVQNDIADLSNLPRDRVDYGAVYNSFWKIFKLAYDNFSTIKNSCEAFKNFIKAEAYWLDDYALFMAIKGAFNGSEWPKWPLAFKSARATKKNLHILPRIHDTINLHKFLQWIFSEQWAEIKKYAHEAKIEIIGDIPIFVGLDSADIWANRWLFKVKRSGDPFVVAGVPPDAFSSDGQLWGNPTFNWHFLRLTGYKWWINRLRRNFELYDVVRLDHFRGFQANWEVKFGEKTAANGEWAKTAGVKFFKKISKVQPNAKFIAEDLGQINEETREILEKTKLPVMNVLHFAFNGEKNNRYLPHCHEKNSVLYVGTHDNDTTRGWYNSLSDWERSNVRNYLRTSCSDVTWDLIKKSYESTSNLLILTMQDILNLGSEARLNRPSTPFGNWTWRITDRQLNGLWEHETHKYLHHLADIYDRV